MSRIPQIDAGAATVLTGPDEERRQQMIERIESERASIPTLIGAGLVASSSVVRAADRYAWPEDYNETRLSLDDEDTFNELTEGLSPDYWPGFRNAQSYEHALYLRQQYLSRQAARQTLQGAGLTGFAVHMGTMVMDPAELAVGAVTGGAFTALSKARQANRLRRMAQAGLLGGAAGIPVQSYLSATDPTEGGMDIMYAVLGGSIGGMLPGAIGAGVASRRASKAARRAQRDIEYADTRATGAELSEKGKQKYADQVDGRRATEVQQAAVRQAGLDDVDDADVMEALNADRPAQRQPGVEPESIAYTKREMKDDAKLAGATGRSTSKRVRVTGGEVEVSGGPGFTVREQLDNLINDSGYGPTKASTRLKALAKLYDLDGKLLGVRMRVAKAGTLAAGDTFRLSDDTLIEVTDVLETGTRVAKVTRKETVSDTPVGGGTYFTAGNEDGLELELRFAPDEDVVFGQGTYRYDEDVAQQATGLGLRADPERIDAFEALVDFNPDAHVDPVLRRATPDEIDQVEKPPERLNKTTGEKIAGDLDLEGTTTDAASRLTFLRFSGAARLGRKAIPAGVRRVFNGVVEDVLPKVGNLPGTRIPAEVWVRAKKRSLKAQWYAASDRAFARYAKRKGIGMRGRHAAREEFNELVTDAVRMGGTSDPDVQAAADVFSDITQQLGALAKRHGVKFSDRFEIDPNYVPRIGAPDKMHQIMASLANAGVGGEETLLRLLQRAVLQENIDIDEDTAMKVAKMWLSGQTNDEVMTSARRAHAFGGDDLDALRTMMSEFDIDEEAIDIITTRLGRRREPQALTTSLNRRTILDEHAEIDTPIGKIKVTDLLENRADVLLDGYIDGMVGAVAQTEWYKLAKTSADDVVDSLSAAQSRVGRQLRDAGFDEERIEWFQKQMELVDKVLTGRPLQPNTMARRFLRRSRAINYARLSGEFGIAQIPEVAAIITETGALATLRQLPTLMRILARSRQTGRMHDGLLDFVEVVVGQGTDRVTHRWTDRLGGAFDEGLDGQSRRGFWANVDRTLTQGQKVAGDVSGFSLINMTSQRWAALTAIQKMTQLARSGRKLSKARMASLGLSEADADKLMRALRNEMDADRGVQMLDGVTGRRVSYVDVDKWADQDAASMLVTATQRWSTRVIQENTIGSLPLWMNNDIAKTLLQFRTFYIGAWEKQFVYRLATRDMIAFTTTGIQSFAAMLAWIGVNHQRTIGDPDRQEKLEEALRPGRIAAAAVDRAGWASMAPQLADTVLGIAGEEPFFNMRYSGLSSDFISFDNNPTSSFARLIERVVTNGVSDVRSPSENFTRSDAHAIRRTLPFQRVMGINAVLNKIEDQFPEYD